MPNTDLVAIPREQIVRLLSGTQLPMWYIAQSTGIALSTLRRWKNGRIAKASRQNLNRLVVFCQQETLEE